MKKLLTLVSLASCSVLLLTGCLALQLGGGEKHEVQHPSLGQQLTDLKAAHDNGALTDAEYQTQKAKLLGK